MIRHRVISNVCVNLHLLGLFPVDFISPQHISLLCYSQNVLNVREVRKILRAEYNVPKIFPNSRRLLKITSAGNVKCSKFHTEESQILSFAVQNVAPRKQLGTLSILGL